MNPIPQNKFDQRRKQVRQLCKDRNLTITPYGKGWYIRGFGVSIVCSDLAYVEARALEPLHVAER